MAEQEQEPFDVDTITLGEMLAIEQASRQDFMQLAQSKIGLLMIVLYLRHLREHGSALSWSELASHRLSDKYNLRSVSPQE